MGGCRGGVRAGGDLLSVFLAGAETELAIAPMADKDAQIARVLNILINACLLYSIDTWKFVYVSMLLNFPHVSHIMSVIVRGP